MNRRSFLRNLVAVVVSVPSAAVLAAKLATPAPAVCNYGNVTLQAKKLSVLIKVPNELIRVSKPVTCLLSDRLVKEMAKATWLKEKPEIFSFSY